MNARAIAAGSVLLATLLAIPVSAHHSFAMYDQTKVVTLTGVVKQFVPQANHAELHIVMLAPDHKSLAKDKDQRALARARPKIEDQSDRLKGKSVFDRLKVKIGVGNLIARLRNKFG